MRRNIDKKTATEMIDATTVINVQNARYVRALPLNGGN